MNTCKTTVQPTRGAVRLLTTDPDRNEILKAALPPFPQHPRALLTLLSLVGSCRLHGIDPWEYLRRVLGVINDQPVNRVGELAPIYAARKSLVDG